MTKKGKRDRSGAAVRVPPPISAVLTIVAGYFLGRWLPLLTEYELATPDRYWIGGAVIVVSGFAFALWPLLLFRDTEQNPTPWSETPKIIVKGPYKFTRNPMYLSMVMFNFGFAIIFSEAWILAFMPILVLVLYHTAIKHEEAYLEEKFGESFLAYKRSVRRWI